ncbi:MAG: type II secretion system GspH family protein [bacterium]|nr:type II secretion system GspH family protein [bacterium]
MKINKNHKKGFTLIELLVVISIIGLLSSIVLSATTNARKKTRDKARLSEIHQIATGLQLFASDNNGLYPSTGAIWKCLGHTSLQNCWIGTTYQGSNSVNADLDKFIKVPDDPLNNTSCQGDAYLYNSDYTPIGLPRGAYLHWFYEDTSLNTATACGRGVYGGTLAPSCTNYCWLYVGPYTP